jgi:hypothetical protein
MYDKQRPTISLCRSASIDLDDAMIIGHEAFCLHCGKTLNGGDEAWLQCSEHRQSRFCSHCGKYMKMTDEQYEYGDQLYCPDCVFYCDIHKAYEPIDNKYGTILMHDGEKTVCNNAMRNIVQCKDCGRYYLSSEITNGYCKECIKKYEKCDMCGEYLPKDTLHKKKRHKLCDQCMTPFERGVTVTKHRRYNVGDYVLMKDDLSCCTYTCNSQMQERYANRIVRIMNNFSSYHISRLDGWDWNWSTNCFAGVVNNCCDAFVGKTMQEIASLLREENDDEN